MRRKSNLERAYGIWQKNPTKGVFARTANGTACCAYERCAVKFCALGACLRASSSASSRNDAYCAMALQLKDAANMLFGRLITDVNDTLGRAATRKMFEYAIAQEKQQ